MKQVVSIMLCAIVLLSSISACAKPELPQTVAELLDLGEKYLLELNYEQALVQFLKVIEVEPMNPRGYTGAAEAYLGLEDTDGAVAILQQGTHVLPGNAQIQGMLNDLLPQETVRDLEAEPEPLPEIGDEQEPEPEPLSEIQLYLRDLLVQYDTEGYESLYAAAETAEFQEFTAFVDVFPVIYIDATGGYGIGLYKSGESFFVYIGGYAGLLRSGNGFWTGLSNLQDTQNRFEGEWQDDFPNGSGTIVRWRNVAAIERQPNMTYAVLAEWAGAFQNGYYDGSFSVVYNLEDGVVHRWSPVYSAGMGQAASTSPQGNPAGRSGPAIGICHDCGTILYGSDSESRVFGLGAQ